jgi:hypothetical protein
MPTDPKQLPSDGLAPLEFELTDLTSARRALDALPPGIEERKHLEPGYWETRRRRQVLPSDKALTGPTIDWLLSLPEPVRPKNLCQFYPRVANTVSGGWADMEKSAVVVDQLLNDTRGGTRQGFPEHVKVDLQLLLRYLDLLKKRTARPAG